MGVRSPSACWSCRWCAGTRRRLLSEVAPAPRLPGRPIISKGSQEHCGIAGSASSCRSVVAAIRSCLAWLDHSTKWLQAAGDGCSWKAAMLAKHDEQSTYHMVQTRVLQWSRQMCSSGGASQCRELTWCMAHRRAVNPQAACPRLKRKCELACARKQRSQLFMTCICIKELYAHQNC